MSSEFLLCARQLEELAAWSTGPSPEGLTVWWGRQTRKQAGCDEGVLWHQGNPGEGGLEGSEKFPEHDQQKPGNPWRWDSARHCCWAPQAASTPPQHDQAEMTLCAVYWCLPLLIKK